MKPTADQLADAIEDTARGGMVVAGMARDEYLLSLAKLIRARMRKDDTRLNVLAAHTDRTGYVWFPEGAFAWRDEARGARWSYERRVNALFDAAAAAPVPEPAELDGNAEEAARLEARVRAGWQLSSARHDPETGAAGFILERSTSTEEA